MKDTLKPGESHTNSVTIDVPRTIEFMGDELRVYATPWLVRDVEDTCRQLLMKHHDEGEDSVGARVEIDHMAATLVGQGVEITAKVIDVEGPRVTFEVEAHDEIDQIGRARHVRFVIDKAKQGKRLEAKAAKVKEVA